MRILKNRSNETIECMRFICCVSILFIHCGFPLPLAVRGYAMAIARFAVPFLILLSGWYSDQDGKSTKAKKKLRDLAHIIWIGSLVCLLWNCCNSFLKSGEWLAWIIPYLNFRTLLNFLLFNRAVFINSVFYYFFIMVYVYVIFIFAQRFRLTMLLSCLSPLLLLVGIYVCEITDLPWYYGGNFLFLGIPMFMIGHFLRKFSDRLPRLKTQEWFLVLTGVVITGLEYRFFGSHYLYLGAVVIALSVFIFCVNHEDLKCSQLLVLAGTVLSLPIIVIHCEVRDTALILWHFGQYTFPLFVLVTSTILSILYQKIRRRI